jgi:lipid A ethanolaminephosphotransferase
MPGQARHDEPALHNATMALKLFRSTGHSTLLMPGETRLAPHPGWLVLAASLWLGVVCNVALWRALAGAGVGSRTALAVGGLLAGGGGVVLSALGWRRTLKPAITVVLFLGALVACGLWVQGLPVESLWTQRPRALLPPWASLLGWQVPALFAALALLPVAWMWSQPLRRLTGPVQLRANLWGMVLGAAVVGAAYVLLP